MAVKKAKSAKQTPSLNGDQLQELVTAGGNGQLGQVEMEVSVEMGRSKITLDEALDLAEQSLIDLDRMVGEPVDVRLNGTLFARGEVVTVAESFGVRLTEVLAEEE